MYIQILNIADLNKHDWGLCPVLQSVLIILLIIMNLCLLG